MAEQGLNWEDLIKKDLQNDPLYHDGPFTAGPDPGTLNIFRSTLESFKSSIQRLKAGQAVQPAILKSQLNALREARHELYASLFQDENSLEQGRTDEHHLPKVLSEFERLGIPPTEIELLRQKQATEAYTKIREFTPDNVIVEVADNGEPEVTIIDYTVTVRPHEMIDNKLEKYKPILEFYSGYGPNLTVACLSPSSGEQAIRQMGRDRQWNEPRINQDTMLLFRHSIEVVQELMSTIPLDQRDEMKHFLNSQMHSMERACFDSSMPFGITISEFLDKLDKRKGFLWHMESLTQHEKNMFFSGIYHESKGEDGKEELKSRMSEFPGNPVIYSKHDYERFLSCEKSEIMEEALRYRSKEPPVPPTKAVINKALMAHDEESRSRFEVIEDSRLVHHIPFHFRLKSGSEERKWALRKMANASITQGTLEATKEELELDDLLAVCMEERENKAPRTDLEIIEMLEEKYLELCSELEVKEGGNEKQNRYRAMMNALKQVTKQDGNIRFLKDLFSMGLLEDNEYKEFMEGRIKSAVCQRTGEMKTCRVNKRPSRATHGDPLKVMGGAVEDDDTVFYDWMKTKDCHSVALKKGEVIVVRPSGTREAKEFMERAGVGKKNERINRAERREVRKPVSLDLSNPTVRQQKSLEYLTHSCWLVDACQKIGSLIPEHDEEMMLKARKENTKLFTEMSKGGQQIPARGTTNDESSSESSGQDSTRSTGSPKPFPAPKSAPPELGICKAAIENLGTSPIKGKNSMSCLDEVWRGLCHLGRTHQLFYENLSFVSQMASSGYRIVGSNNPGQFLITFPSESIMKGQATIPYVVVTVVLPGDVYLNPTDKHEEVYKLKCGGEIHLTKGRRPNRDQMTGHVSAYPRFMIATEILEHYREESGMGPLTPLDLVNAYQFVHCININTSSLMDNMRYMVEVCMGQLSYIDKFIEDKLMVPAKTEMHMFLYVRMRELLSNINQSMDTVRMKVPSLDEEGTVDITTLRIVDGSFESYLFSGHYRKPDHLLMELITLFFCTSKGLHGKHHNLVEIHKTPLSIQEELNKYLPQDFVSHPANLRMQYSPKVMRAAVKAAEMSTTSPSDEIRMRFMRRENPGGHPASVSTLSSTSSTLVEADEGDDMQVSPDVPLEEIKMKSLDPSKKADAINELQAFEEKLPTIKGEINKRKAWRKVKKKISKILGTKEGTSPLTDNLCMDPRAGVLLRKSVSTRQKIRQHLKGMLDDEWRREAMGSGSSLPRGDFARRWRERFKFYDSGVVFTEVLRYSEERLRLFKTTTISGMAKEHVKNVGGMRVAIRPKGQRTQKDREIFVVDLLTKTALYLLEHMYKQICSTIQAEKISMPGDSKVIDMYTQTKSELTWCKRTMESFARVRESAENDIPVPENVYCLHHNIDMTKWAPKDNLQKFNWAISCSSFFTVEEKFYYIGVLDIMWSKEIYIDDDVMLESMKSTMSGDFEAEECLFYRMTNGYQSNMVPIKQTWLQGQLNYLSSFVHVGAMKLYEEAMHTLYPKGNCMVNINVHSDDNETTLCCATDMGAEEVAIKSWNVIEYFCKGVCIELSKKKSSISMQCKQFIAIYNIGGEQIHPWVKAAMTVVSGLPYLTISDDISSAWSKIAEAGSKGAPKKVMRLCHEVTRIHVLDVHGILNRRTGKNKFSESLGVDETVLPMMLGGCHIRDWSSFVICGPKSIDKGNMMHCLKTLTGARADIEPGFLPSMEHRSGEERSRHENTVVSRNFRALKLFILADTMCYDQADDEEDSSACKGMNFFRPAKFKTRRTGMKSPFDDLSKEKLAETAKEYKKENPCIMLKKPTDQRDLRKYCICQYADPKFQDSLAGQSPNMLMLGLIQSRHKPRFRLLQTGSVNKEEDMQIRVTIADDDIEGKVAAGLPITFEEVSSLLNERLSVTNPNLADCRMLWRRYIANDPEFKSVQFALENCTTTTSYRRLNLVPSKKPDFSKYSELVNNVSDIIVYLMDSEYCRRNGFGLYSPKSAVRDWNELSRMFPRETACMRMKATRNPKKMENLIEVLKLVEAEKIREESKEANAENERLIKEQNLSTREKQEMLESVRKRMEKRILDEISWADELSKREEWNMNEFESHLISMGRSPPEWMSFKEDDKKYYQGAEESLSRDLLRMARTFKGRTARVLFTPPTHTDDILEMSLQLRSSLESTGEYQLRMFLNANLSSSRTKQMLTDNPTSVQWYYKASDALSHLYELCRLLGSSELLIKSVLEDTTFCGRPIMEIQSRFPKLPTEYQHRVIVPLYVCRPTFAKLVVESMGPYLKEWKVKQNEYGRGEFLCEVKGSGFNLTASGFDTTIKSLTISYTGRIPLGPINMVMTDLAKDIRNAGMRNKKQRINLTSVLTTEPVSRVGTVLLDVSRNRLAFWGEKTNYLQIKGLHVEKVYGSLDREIRIKELTPSKNGIVCADGTVSSIIFHRLAKNPEYQLMSVPSVMMGGLDVSSLARMPGLGGLVRRKIDCVNLQELIKCTEKPGVYTDLYASMQSKIMYKMLNPGHQDRWLDEMDGPASTFDRVLKYLKQSILIRQKVDHYTRRIEELDTMLKESQYSSEDGDTDDEEAVLKEMFGDVTREELEEYIRDLRAEREENKRAQGGAELIMQDIQTCKREISKCIMPEESFRSSNTLRDRSAMIMTRLQHFEDINTQMVLKRIDRVEDILSFCKRLDKIGMIELAKSPVDVIKRLPSSEIRSMQSERRRERIEGSNMSPEEMFNNCCYNPMNPEEVELASTILSIMVYCYTERKALTKLSIKKYWNSMSDHSRPHAMALVEEVASVMDTRAFQIAPSIASRSKSSGLEPWELTFEDAIDRVARLSRSNKLRYRPHFKLIETLISTLRNDITSAQGSKRGTVGLRQLSQGVSRSTNRFNRKLGIAERQGMDQKQRMEFALLGSQMTGASNTDTSEDDRQPTPSVLNPRYANTVSIRRTQSELEERRGEESDQDDVEEIDLGDFDSDEPTEFGMDAYQDF
nr:RNA-dependent RNA-polymerase [Bronnoya virus]